MPKLIIDADDFGLSKAINHGIIESYKTGITTSTLLMPNLETAEHGVHLAKDHPDLFIGQHTNFLLGKPCANPAEIPSLVDTNGKFHRSKYYRANPDVKFQYDDVRTETIAQMERFKSLTGHYPKHIDCHSIGDETVDQVFWDISQEFGIHTTLKYSGTKTWPDQDGYWPIAKLLESGALPYIQNGVTVENFLNDDFGLLKLAPDEIVEMHFDVGFLDQFVLDNSSYTLMRCRELATICDVRVRNWLEKNGCELISFADLAK